MYIIIYFKQSIVIDQIIQVERMKGLHHQVARYYYINSKQIYLFVPTLINGSLANSGTQTLQIKYN